MGLNFKSYIRITDNIFYTSFTKLIDCYVPFWYIADTNRGKKNFSSFNKANVSSDIYQVYNLLSKLRILLDLLTSVNPRCTLPSPYHFSLKLYTYLGSVVPHSSCKNKLPTHLWDKKNNLLLNMQALHLCEEIHFNFYQPIF